MKHLIVSTLFICKIVCTHAQDFSKTMNKAFLITRMAEKFHLQPRTLNDTLSTDLFTAFLKELDEHHTIFLADDISRLSAYQFQLDDAITKRSTDFLTLASSLYTQRIRQNDSLVNIICKTAFNFFVAENIIIKETSYAASVAAKQVRLAKIIKWQVADAITDNMPQQFINASAQKKFIDSAEAAERKLILNRTTKRYSTLLNPSKSATTVSLAFCNSLAQCYDPHTVYMPMEEKEEFDEGLGQRPLRFGISLDETEEGEVMINKLLAGSSAFKSGMLNAGDKIIAVQEPGRSPVNVSSFMLLQVDSVLNEISGDQLMLTVKKPDGTTKQVSITKERFSTEEDEEDKVQGYVLKGAKNVGYISIPDFYVDWENAETGVAGCANDVAKEIIKLKKENINGLILDIRYNGGGSMNEAIELAGIFIDGGPVGLYKDKTPKPVTLKDVNGGSIYDGPLLIMVNGYSASASEMLSGTLQDYNRAFIAGTPTYGKATGQVVLPLDTLVTYETIDRFQSEDYLKVTTFGLYRVNGTTAQKRGVMPDIVLPDVLNTVITKEKDEPFAFTLSSIEPNKYYRPLPPLITEPLKTVAKSITDTSLYFRKLREYEQWGIKVKAQKEISLNWDEMVLYKQQQQQFFRFFEEYKVFSVFTVANHKLQGDRLKQSEWLTAIDEETKEYIQHDPYIQICYQLLMQLK